MSTSTQSKWQHNLVIIALILAGETIFLLPFVVARIFRPTFLDVFGLTNLQLGTAFSVYGFVAMLAYFAGGPLADRFSAKRLMAFGLVCTSFGGIIFANIPSLKILTILYAFWGMTTVLFFWAALIKATREWGGKGSQGKAYGLLDGGRGLMAALLATITVAIFASLLPSEVESATLEQRSYALGRIIWLFTGLIVLISVLVWMVVPDSTYKTAKKEGDKFTLEGLKKVLSMPAIWLQAIIVVAAYVSFKATDDFSLFARDAFGYNDVEAAQVGTISFWVRPFAAIGAGFLADYFKTSRVIIVCFIILIIGSTFIAMGALQPGIHWMLIMTIIGTSIGIYALRGIYFPLFEEAKVPMAFTGSAVGLVSVIGYTPDIFMGPLMGYLIDRSPGALGHQHVFAVVAGFAFVGLIATLTFRYVTKHNRSTES